MILRKRKGEKGGGVRKASVSTRRTVSMKTKAKDPSTATYSILCGQSAAFSKYRFVQTKATQGAYMFRRPRNGTGMLARARGRETKLCVEGGQSEARRWPRRRVEGTKIV